MLEHTNNISEAVKYYQKLIGLRKYDDFAKLRISKISEIKSEDVIKNENDGIDLQEYQLKHPECVIENTLAICMPDPEKLGQDKNEVLENVVKNINSTKSPSRKVRFENITSSISSEVNESKFFQFNKFRQHDTKVQ